MKPEREGVEHFHFIWCTNSLHNVIWLSCQFSVVSEHRGYVWSRAVPHTHISSCAVHLATPIAVDALTKPLLPSPVWGLLVSTHWLKPSKRTQTVVEGAVSVVSGSEEVFIQVEKTLSVFTHNTRVSLTGLSLSAERIWEGFAANCH